MLGTLVVATIDAVNMMSFGSLTLAAGAVLKACLGDTMNYEVCFFASTLCLAAALVAMALDVPVPAALLVLLSFVTSALGAGACFPSNTDACMLNVPMWGVCWLWRQPWWWCAYLVGCMSLCFMSLEPVALCFVQSDEWFVPDTTADVVGSLCNAGLMWPPWVPVLQHVLLPLLPLSSLKVCCHNARAWRMRLAPLAVLELVGREGWAEFRACSRLQNSIVFQAAMHCETTSQQDMLGDTIRALNFRVSGRWDDESHRFLIPWIRRNNHPSGVWDALVATTSSLAQLFAWGAFVDAPAHVLCMVARHPRFDAAVVLDPWRPMAVQMQRWARRWWRPAKQAWCKLLSAGG